jgi:transaldolase
MAIFLDTSDKSEIERFHRMGVIRGVTTNPTMLLKEGVGGGLPVIEEHLREIAEMTRLRRLPAGRRTSSSR